MCSRVESPSICYDEQRAEQYERVGDFQSCALDKGIANIALSPFSDSEIETTGVSAEIPIYSLAG